MHRASLLALVAFGLAAALAAIAGRLGDRSAASRDELAGRIPALGRADYRGSDACAACHPAAHATWAATYHRTMTQPAGPAAVRASWQGELAAGEARVVLERRGEEFWAELLDPEVRLAQLEGPGPIGPVPRVWRRVVMTTGSHHMQVYWTASARDRRLHALPFAYLLAEARWVPVESTLLRPAQGDVIYTWNRACVPCHAVAGQPRISGEGGSVDTRVAELGIACEACHGPGAAHVDRWRSPLARYLQHLGGGPDGTIVQPARLDHRRASEVCGQCHSVSAFHDEEGWLRRGDDFRPGEDLEARRRVVRHPVRAAQPWLDELLDEDPEYLSGRMWPDGHVRVTGREHSALLETPCYQRGELSCLSCHQLHGAPPDDQLGPAGAGAGSCASCHAPEDSQEHTRHPAGSLSCYDCHMPRTTYGLLKAVRSHVVDSPDVATALAVGRPDACSLCHVDRPLAWTAGHLERWTGRAQPELPDEHRRVSAAVLWAIRGDAGQRALAADALGHPDALALAGAGWQAPILAHLVAQDPYDAVRQIAARSLRGLPDAADLDLDPLAPAAARADAALRALARWRAQAPDPARLVAADGQHDAAALAALAAIRDDRPIDLKE